MMMMMIMKIITITTTTIIIVTTTSGIVGVHFFPGNLLTKTPSYLMLGL